MENLAFKQQLAEYLLNIQAVKLQPNDPFTWASGWKSPIYCDNRKILSHQDVRTYVKNGLCDLVNAYFSEVDCIAGVATAGIAHAALIADALNLPMVYVRSSAKSHGLSNIIEGELRHGSRVVVVEDTISTGGSSMKAIKDLRHAGAEVIGLTAIFKYGFQESKDLFHNEGVVVKTLTNYTTLLEVAKKHALISENDLESLNLWQASPSNWNN